MTATALPIEQVRSDGGTQSRVQLDWIVIDEYAAAMRDGAVFPPIVVFYDGAEYWLADGFHRLEAGKRAESAVIAADVRQGTVRDAILYSVGANAAHGLRRSNADKRAAVLRLLEDAEWGRWADSEIARRCVVNQSTVSRIRESSPMHCISEPRAYITKHGTAATMNVSAIGRGNGNGERVLESGAALPFGDEPEDDEPEDDEPEDEGEYYNIEDSSGHVETVYVAAGETLRAVQVEVAPREDATHEA